MKKAIDFFTAHPARFFLLAALLWGGFMCLISIIRGKFDLEGLLTEANGMVFDLLVFGVLLSIYEALREKKDKIERLHEEIDDYRGWDEKEATYRIVGAIRRLNKLGVTTDIDLRKCYLKKANLSRAKLKMANLGGVSLHCANFRRAELAGTNFADANLQEAVLQEANLESANLNMAILFKTNLQGANLQRANLFGVDLHESNLQEANLQWTKLFGADLHESNLQGANLLGASVDKDWFQKLEAWKVIGREEIKKNYLIDKIEFGTGVLREKQ